MIPWRGGKCVAWDVTVTDTLAKSYLHATSSSAGGAAELAATRKTEKYSHLPSSYDFIPVAIETFGPVNEEASEFLTDIGRRIAIISDEKREIQFLRQRISLALQRFNAVCFRGSFSEYDDPEFVECSSQNSSLVSYGLGSAADALEFNLPEGTILNTPENIQFLQEAVDTETLSNISMTTRTSLRTINVNSSQLDQSRIRYPADQSSLATGVTK